MFEQTDQMYCTDAVQWNLVYRSGTVLPHIHHGLGERYARRSEGRCRMV